MIRRFFSACLFIFLFVLVPTLCAAGFTETLPKDTFMLDESYAVSYLNSRWDDNGNKAPLIDPIDRYEPGGGSQGTLTPNVKASYHILINQLQYGLLDNISLAIGVPVVMKTKVDPNFEWEEGDYQWALGRPYSEEDFWQWAGSMGQPKPGAWEGNHGVLSDIIIGTRIRFTDGSDWFRSKGLAVATTISGALPTGRPADPEEVVAAGTTTWELHSNGDLNLHLSMDKFFKESLDDRLTLGLDAFYEFLLPHRYDTPTGEKNPLLLTYSPYVGKHYTIDGGDFSGAAGQIDVVPIKGPALATWVVKHDAQKAAALPPLWTLTFRYTFTYLQQTDWQSDSGIWDYDREKLWKPGYKNILFGQTNISFLRLGAPVQTYFSYRNQSWIPGKNSRAADVMAVGLRVLMKFW